MSSRAPADSRIGVIADPDQERSLPDVGINAWLIPVAPFAPNAPE